MNESKKIIFSFSVLFFIVPLLYFEKLTEFVFNSSIFDYFDEVLILIFLVVVFLRFIKDRSIQKNHAIIIISAIFLVGISLIHKNAPVVKIILQTFIHLKLFMFFCLFELFFKERQGLLYGILKIVLILTISGLILSFILQESFTSFFELVPVYRYGFVRSPGFQLEINHVAVTLSLYYLYYLFIVQGNDNIRNYIIITFFYIILVFFTGSRTVLIVIPISFVFIFKNKRNIYIKYFLAVGAVIATLSIYFTLKDSELYKISTQNLADTLDVEDGGYIRGIMIYHGVNLALDNFPFGTGAASFGTVMSEGSPVYSKLGLDKMSFFIEMTGVFDSNLASILGEFGFTGLLLFFFLFYKLYRSIYYKINCSLLFEKNKRYYQSLLILIFIYSISMGVMMNAYNSAIFALFLNLYPYRKKSIHPPIFQKENLSRYMPE